MPSLQDTDGTKPVAASFELSTMTGGIVAVVNSNVGVCPVSSPT